MAHAQDARFHFRPTKWWPEVPLGNEYVFAANLISGGDRWLDLAD